jgi:hypothetical protein
MAVIGGSHRWQQQSQAAQSGLAVSRECKCRVLPLRLADQLAGIVLGLRKCHFLLVLGIQHRKLQLKLLGFLLLLLQLAQFALVLR